MQQNEMIKIEGTVKSLIYRNEESGYAVLRLFAAETGREITAVGALPFICAGEEIEALGMWTSHPEYGEQFLVREFTRTLPTDADGILNYLSSGAIKGIGPKTAEKITGRFGKDTFDILENYPEKLAEIRGITRTQAFEIQNRFLMQSSLKRLMEFLSRFQIEVPVALKLYKKYGKAAEKMIRQDPYLLCDEYFNVGFIEADQLASIFEIPADHEKRRQAGIIFELIYNLDNGHTFIPRQKLSAAASQLMDLSEDLILEDIDTMCGAGILAQEHICSEDAIYLTRVYESECYVAKRVSDLIKWPDLPKRGVRRLTQAIERRENIAYSEAQREAIELAVSHGIFILTGGPGTGKTTVLKGMLEVFQKMDLKVSLAAPTGRAAKRLSELCGCEAKTVHRLLEVGHSREEEQIKFLKNEKNPLQADVVIVDEVSMVDILLMSDLLKAIKPNARLILVGDPDQLPPVGPGSLLRDLIASGVVPMIALKEIFRQAKNSDIIMNAHRINRGEMPDLHKNSGDFYFVPRYSPDAAVSAILELCQNRIPSRFQIDIPNIQIISPAKNVGVGTVKLNMALQAQLNPPSEEKKEKRFGDLIFREGDRVMQVRNNYDLVWKKTDSEELGTGVFNGDIGTIQKIDPRSELLIVDFGDRLAEYQFEMLSDLELAYAVTVHKAQGSEFAAVIFVAMAGARRLMNRNILYTGATRAKKLLVIVGQEAVVQKMVESNQKNRRYGALKNRLQLCTEEKAGG